MSVQTLIERSCEKLGEGPHWEDAIGTLLYVDIDAKEIHRWSSVNGMDEKHILGETVSFIVPCRMGGYIIGLGQTISHYDWDTKKVTVLHRVEEGKNTLFNDGKCDASGRLWCGTHGIETEPLHVEPEQGALYSLEVDGSLRKHKDKLTIANGLAWSPDNYTMYFIDSYPRKIFAYDFDIVAGIMSNETVAVDFGDQSTIRTNGLPDGMTIDKEGKLWVACFMAGKVSRYDPLTGKELMTVATPAIDPTSCCFGGPEFAEMYVTSSRYHMTEEEKKLFPLGGSVFKITGLGVKGLPAVEYEGFPSV